MNQDKPPAVNGDSFWWCCNVKASQENGRGSQENTRPRAQPSRRPTSQVTPPYILHSDFGRLHDTPGHQAKEAWARRLAYFFLADFCGVPSGAREEEKEVNVMLQQQVMGDEAMLLTL